MMAPATASAAMPSAAMSATAIAHLAAAGIAAAPAATAAAAATELLRSGLRLTLELAAATVSASATAIVVLETPLLEIPAPVTTTAERLRRDLLILETAAKIIAAEILTALEVLIVSLVETLIDSLPVPTATEAAAIPAIV